MEKEKLAKANLITFDIQCCKNHIGVLEKAREYETVYIDSQYDSTQDTIVLDLKTEPRIEEAYQLFLDTLLTIEDEAMVKLEKEFDEL